MVFLGGHERFRADYFEEPDVVVDDAHGQEHAAVGFFGSAGAGEIEVGGGFAGQFDALAGLILDFGSRGKADLGAPAIDVFQQPAEGRASEAGDDDLGGIS